jgi:NAD(P)-dependent dehydrogenase (short-subunit alcohol dehydrogenase family)
MSLLHEFFRDHRLALGGLAGLGSLLFLAEETVNAPKESRVCSGPRMLRIGGLVVLLTLSFNFALQIPLPYEPVNLVGKTYLVTGCTPGGVGEATARELLAWNASHVICTMRTPEKAESLRASMAGVGPGKLETVIMELTSFDSVRSAAKEIRERFGKLDGIMLNAGLMTSTRRITNDGFEEMFQVNHLSQYLLLRLLEDRLRESSARVSLVSSSSYIFMASLDKEVYSGKPGGRIGWDDATGQWMTYADTKLMNILTANAFARRLAQNGIKVNSVCPGLVATGFQSRMPADIITKFVEELAVPFFSRSAREGALRPLDTMANTNETGAFFDSYIPVPLSPQINSANEDWLFTTSSQLVGLSA